MSPTKKSPFGILAPQRSNPEYQQHLPILPSNPSSWTLNVAGGQPHSTRCCACVAHALRQGAWRENLALGGSPPPVGCGPAIRTACDCRCGGGIHVIGPLAVLGWHHICLNSAMSSDPLHVGPGGAPPTGSDVAPGAVALPPFWPACAMVLINWLHSVALSMPFAS